MNEHVRLLNLPRPGYHERFAGRCCRTLCALTGVDNDCRTAVIAEGALVAVNYGNYLDDPGPDDDNYRFNVSLLTESGAEDPRGVSYDGAASCMLSPEPGVCAWLPDDQKMAAGQGWQVFDCDGSEGPPWQLQKIDGSEAHSAGPEATVYLDRFATDNDAWRFVWKRALEERCPVASRALMFLYYRSPDEYAEIRKLCTAKGD